MFMNDLPKYLARGIVNNWFTVENVCIFDSAVCNSVERSRFLNLIEGAKMSGVNNRYAVKRYLRWIVNRKILINNLSVMVEDFCMLKCGTALDILKQMQVLTINCFVTGITDKDFIVSIHHCSNLTDLRVSFPAEITTDRTIELIANSCPQLATIHWEFQTTSELITSILSVTDTDTSTSLKSVNKILKKWDNFHEDDAPFKLTRPNTEDGSNGEHRREYPKEIEDEVKFHMNRLKELLGNFDSKKILEDIEIQVDSNKKLQAQTINKNSEDFATALSPLFRNVPADAFKSPVPQTHNKVENLFSANFSPRKQLSGANANIVPFANANKNQLKSQNSLTDDFECENEDEQRTNREIEPFILPSASKSKKVPSPIKADDPEDSENNSTPNDVNKLTVHDLDTDTTPRGFRTNYANSNSKHKFSFGANSMNVPNSGSQFLSPESGYNNLQNWSNRYSLGVNRFSVSTKLNFNNNTGIPVPNNRNSVVFQNTLANSGFPNTSASQTVNLAATQNFNLGSTYDSRSSYLNLNNSFRGVINMNDPQPITPQYNTSSNAIQEALLSAYKSGAPSGVNSITSNCTATTNNTVFGAMTSDPTPPPPLTVNSFVEFSVVSVKREVLSAVEKPTRSSLQPVEVSTVFTGSGGSFDSGSAAKESMIGNIYDYCFPHGAALKYVTLKEYNQLFPAAIRMRINSGDHSVSNTSNSRANSYDNADNSGTVASASTSKSAKAANIRYHIMQFTNENNVVNYATIVTFLAEFRAPSPALKDNLIELEMYALASNIIKRYIFYYQYRCKYLAKCEISRKWKDNITHSRNNSLDPTSAEYASLSSKQRRSSMSEASVSSHTTSKSLLSSVFHWVGHSKSTSQSSLPAAESTRSQHMSVPAKLSSIPKAQAPRNQRTLFERIAGKNKPTKHRAIRTSSSAYNIEFTPMSTEKVKHNKSKSCVETSSVTTASSGFTNNNSVSIADLSKELRAERNLEESNARKTRAYNRKEPITRTNIKNNNNSNITSDGDNSIGDSSNNTTPALERKIYKQRSYSDNVLGGTTLRLQTDLSTLLETSNEASGKTPLLHHQNSSSTADSQNSGDSFGFVSDLSGSFNLNNSFSSVGGDTNIAAKQKSLSSPFSGSFASMRSLSADQAQESNTAQKSSQFAKASRTNSANAATLQRAEDDDASADSDFSRSYSYSEDSISISVNHLNSASDVTSQPMTGQSAATHNTYNAVYTPTADGYSGLNISRSTSEDVYMRDQMQPMNSGNHSKVYDGDNMNESLDHCSSNDSSFEFNNTTHAVTGNASLGSKSHCSVDDFRPSTGYGEDFPSSYATKYARHTSSKHQTVAVVSQYQKVAVVSEKAYCIISDKPLHVAFFEILEAIVEQECSEPENNSDDKREETLFSFLQYLQGYDFSDLHCMGQHYKGYHNSAKDRKKAEKAAQLLRQESFNKNISPRIYARNEDIRISFPAYLHKSVVVVPNKITLLEEWTAAVLFSIIPAEVVVKIVSMLLLEKSLLVCASDISLATAVSTAFAQLLRPFTWEGIFVPLLPFAAYEVLDAPVPYIIGVMAHTKPNVTVGPTTAILFIDDFLSSPDEYISTLETKIPHALHSPVKSPIPGIGATQFTPGGRRSVVDHTDNNNNSYSATDTTPLHLKSMKHFQPPSVYEGSNSNIHLTDPASVTILRDLCVFVTYHARILRDSVQKPKCTTDTRVKRSPRNSDKAANKTHNMIKNIVSNITSEGVRSLRLILKRIFAHNAQLCGNVLTHMDGWLKFGAVNPVSNMFEFQPELFMEPMRLRMQYQENVIHTQMFVSFMDKQRVNYIQQTGLRLFLSDWIFYRLTVRKQRRTLHRRKLTVY